MATDTPAYEFKDRDVVILRELANDPGISSRDLADVLAEDHDIDVSYVTVNESIRNMREAGVFQEAIMPNEEYFVFELFEFKFNPEYFAEEWRDTMEHIRDDQHTLLYFLSDGEYQWKSIMLFPTRERGERWLHEFYKHHGKTVLNVRTSVMTNVLEFGASPELFDSLDAEDAGTL
jgi:hypothetical protein